MTDPVSRAALEDLKRRHIEYAIAKLSSEESRALFASNVKAALDAVLAAHVEDVLDVDAIVRWIEAGLADAALRKGLRPLAKTIALLEVARLREDASPLGDYVPDKARADIRELLERPGIVSAKLVSQIAQHEASEAVMREVLDDVIKGFQDKVNPFTSEWGLPSLLKKMGPLGLGLAKTLESVQAEFEKRVEPELKRYLQVAAKRALKMTAGFVVERADQPAFVSLRKEIFAWLLEQPTNEVLLPDEKAFSLTESAAFEITRHTVTMEAAKRRRRATIEMVYSAHKKQSVKDALATYGIEPVFDPTIIAAALFRPVQAWLKSPAALVFFDEVIGGFYDAEIAGAKE